jgi:hypothetical protein
MKIPDTKLPTNDALTKSRTDEGGGFDGSRLIRLSIVNYSQNPIHHKIRSQSLHQSNLNPLLV